MAQVCVSLRDAINRDVLPWMDIIVQNPLSRRLSDEILLGVTSRAKGRLRTLVLFNCYMVTDNGLLVVVQNNPLIDTLYLPGCTSLTPEGVVNVVKTISSPNGHGVKSLQINGIYNLKKEHLQALQSHLQTNQTDQFKQHRIFFHHYHRNSTPLGEIKNRPIDVGICPKCDEVRMVFSCPKQSCELKRIRSRGDCQGCRSCIPRCAECGGCVDSEELEEALCGDILCLDCWLRLPKCNFCNRPYCTRHHSCSVLSSELDGFVCSACDYSDNHMDDTTDDE